MERAASIAKRLPDDLLRGMFEKSLAGRIFIRNTQDAGNHPFAGHPDQICEGDQTGSILHISTQFTVYERGIISVSPVKKLFFSHGFI
jgi:hypothetical protein